MKTFHRSIIITLATFIAISISIMTVYGYGGGGISSGSKDSYGNMFKYDTMSQNLVFNQSINYTFVDPDLSIYEILINGKNSEPDVSVRVEDLINTSVYANESAPGIVYRNENVRIGSYRINYIKVRFRVNNSWINSNGLNDSRYPHLLKWDGETWLVLKTDIINKDNIYTYFEAPKAGSTSASIFAISVQKYVDPLIENTIDVVSGENTISGENTTDLTSGENTTYVIYGEKAGFAKNVDNITKTGVLRGNPKTFEILLFLSISIMIVYILKKT